MARPTTKYRVTIATSVQVELDVVATSPASASKKAVKLARTCAGWRGCGKLDVLDVLELKTINASGKLITNRHGVYQIVPTGGKLVEGH